MRHATTGCPSRALVEGPVCRIDRCGCGTLHLTIGAFTMRLRPLAARELSDALIAALAEESRDGRAPRPLC